jgi:dolichyl-phosphate beta-glucosyltransferase
MTEAKGSIIGFMDADYKTPIEEIEKMLPWLGNGYEIVIGSRALRGSQIEVPQPFYRRWGSQLFGVVMHALVGLPDIVDTQCGFKFFTRKAALDIFSRQKVDGYMFDIEILCLSERLGYQVKEVPIRWINDPDSRLQLVRGNLRNLRELLDIRARLNGFDRCGGEDSNLCAGRRNVVSWLK